MRFLVLELLGQEGRREVNWGGDGLGQSQWVGKWATTSVLREVELRRTRLQRQAGTLRLYLSLSHPFLSSIPPISLLSSFQN